MAIKTAYVSKLGKNHLISPHFKLGEFQCNDGSNKVLYSQELLSNFEKTIEYLNASILINSGYRTPSYNKKIGGASNSQHIKGTAADVQFKIDGKILDAKKACCLAQTLGFKGIGYISSRSIHLDMRTVGTYRGDERYGYGGNVGNDFYKYFKISKSEIEKLKYKNTIEIITTPTSTSSFPEWLEGMKLGLTDGTNPSEDCKRSQIMTFIARKITGNSKLKISESIDFCKNKGISSGQSPDLYSTRNQVIVMLYRAITGKKEESFDKAWEWAKQKKLTDGSRQNDTATREEAMTLLLRSEL